MDVNTLRIIATLVSFATFLGIWYWAFARKNKDRFEEDGRIPLEHD